MSTQIELLYPGCSGAQLVDKINEIISVLNDVDQTTDYEKLENKPSINGVTISGELTTKDLPFSLEDASDFSSVMDTLATKAEVSDVIEDASTAAVSEVSELLSGKVDSDPVNVSEATLFNENSFIYIFTPQEGIHKVKISLLSDNIAIRSISADNLKKAVITQMAILAVSGEQDGSNTTFKIESDYISGTSMLFLNGQRLAPGIDYMEIPYGFTIISEYIPEKDDIILFQAVPK